MAFFNVLSESSSRDNYSGKDNYADADREINDEIRDEIYGLEEQSTSDSVARKNPKNLPSARCRPLTVHASNIGGRSQQGLVSYSTTNKVIIFSNCNGTIYIRVNSIYFFESFAAQRDGVYFI